MRFFKKIDMSKETRKLGDEYMPNGSIRVLNPYEVQKPKSGESEPETCPTAIFKRIESRKVTLRNDGNSDANNEPESRTEGRDPEAKETQLSLSPSSSPSPENERKEDDDKSEQND